MGKIILIEKADLIWFLFINQIVVLWYILVS